MILILPVLETYHTSFRDYLLAPESIHSQIAAPFFPRFVERSLELKTVGIANSYRILAPAHFQHHSETRVHFCSVFLPKNSSGRCALPFRDCPGTNVPRTYRRTTAYRCKSFLSVNTVSMTLRYAELPAIVLPEINGLEYAPILHAWHESPIVIPDFYMLITICQTHLLRG
ncbi:hypothetical protein B0H34DRAFT_492497 [Crassisporium funariophilum]|nr:hypothetical protein B0H34DRAFT_492497 [Crassisporium funariophilum]